MEVSGVDAQTAGGYRVRLTVAGDVDGNGTVDGVDGQLLTAALGSQTGGATYNSAADLNRDGRVDGADMQLQAGNFGFAANRAPVLTTRNILTHVDLPLVAGLDQLVSDPEDE